MAASHVRASGSRAIATRRSASCASSCRMNLLTIVSMTAGVSGLKVTVASSRFRNSGVKIFSTAAFERAVATFWRVMNRRLSVAA